VTDHTLCPRQTALTTPCGRDIDPQRAKAPLVASRRALSPRFLKPQARLRSPVRLPHATCQNAILCGRYYLFADCHERFLGGTVIRRYTVIAHHQCRTSAHSASSMRLAGGTRNGRSSELRVPLWQTRGARAAFSGSFNSQPLPWPGLRW
jgi:hypothetical protein